VPTDDGFKLTIRVASSTVNIDMPVVDEVREACSMPNGRLAVFGRLNGGGDIAYDVYVINGATGAEVDALRAYSPAMSPDQHWLALRDFYPLHGSEPTEQYMLYDLTKDVEGNKVPGGDYPYAPRYGRTMYPATEKHAPFQAVPFPPARVHQMAGDGSFR
jgi:hypothetical protein